MKIYIRQGAILLLLTATLLAAGCGKTNERFTAQKRSGDVMAQGMMLCYQCHNDTDNPASLHKVFGNSPAVVGWLNSPHANNETFSFVTYKRYDLSPDNIGFPYYGYEGLGQSSDCSTKCHDQLGDGRLIDSYAAKTGDISLGRVDRPVVGCDSCHGAGNGHMAEAKPGPGVCGQCHSSEFFHNHYHPEADNIVEDYNASPHAKSPNINGMNICSRCHTNEGAQAYIGLVNGTEDPADISYALNSQSDIENPTAVQCATCHEAHTLELLGEISDAGDGKWSAQFKTCTSCHQLYDKTGAINNSIYHNGWAPDVAITDTHFDDPSDSNIQGYIINATISHSVYAGNSNGGTCLDCHNEHNADNTINRQWAHSSHGGRILDTVDPVTGIGNVTEADAIGWVRRDFKASNRQACQRCHTATGFRNLANDPAAYDPANNVFTATGEQREMLYCWACHTNNVGGFRNPGIFNTTISPYSQPVDRINAVGDLKGSNICMACHSGRHSGDEIKNPLVPIDFTNSRASTSHHFVAGGIMFNTIGYEYDGLDYSNSTWFRHRYIGLTEPGGENGPCVGCHMSAEAVGHTLDVVEKNDSGVITEVTAIEVCNNCHSRHPWTAETLEEKAEGFADARTALGAMVTAKRGACGSRDWTCPYPDTGSNEPEKTMGAYFNNRLMGDEPGAFAHNSEYTKRLIFDSYDWMDNGIINGTIDLSSYPVAAEWFQEDGTTAADDAVERP